MKKLSQFVLEAKELELQDNTMNYASSDAIQKYMKIAGKFISPEAKEICNWLIAHNGTYMKEIGTLQSFYAKGKPKDASLAQLYKNIGKLAKANRLLEVPVFQTEDQFESIITGKENPDEVLLDLNSEKGRNAVVKKYTPLVWKIARSFNGKTGLSLDELFSAGLEGLTTAMNGFGKSAKFTQKNGKMKDKSDAEMDALLDKEKEEARKKYTFLSYAAYMIRILILEAIKNESHLVRIPTSVQNKERKETGRNTKSNSVSGDDTIGHDSDGKSKTMFDMIGGDDDADMSLDKQDMDKLWRNIKRLLEKNFSEKTIDIFYSMNGLFGNKKMKGKEIMAKYHLKNPSEISNSNWKVLNFIRHDKVLRDAFAELYSLYKECLNDEENRNADVTPLHINI